MTTSYDDDVIAWAEEQVWFLDTARFECLDVKKCRRLYLLLPMTKIKNF